jgi:hypothetical protein
MHGHGGWGHHCGGGWGGGGFGWIFPAVILGRLISDAFERPGEPAPLPAPTPQVQAPRPAMLASATAARPAGACPSCGGALDAGFRFCPHCGRKVAPPTCAYCGQVLTPEMRYCAHCGGPVQ